MDPDNKPEVTYLINDVSKRVGLSQKRIREYETNGFIRPIREPKTNNRRYTEADIRQIQRVKVLIHEHGFTVSCLKYFLSAAPCWVIFECGQKEICPTYGSVRLPCYEMIEKTGVPDRVNKCRQCPIYLNRDQRITALLEKP
ncbi:MerR family transcriptional regulator [Desulfosarcina ovata]|uniref:HTH merR-type domain-containing protein n=2 Tax=Desulfosarcina ovata TaxID=83564 RepID=A0A5K8ALH1_9BACT|nr:MerR family transcriptional regulator [Desulfosarcina ovata]BBO85613.1 hypothetical protein DSCO28_61790 [Desulfosarcina ovata subsp. sediminis]BBO92650.1 hypothetical protein DSCOOX_58300 [Desulfosarcina ovata subsp. ovata]